MEKMIFKLFLIIIISAGVFIYTFPWSYYGINMPFSGKDYRLGLDLQGGIELDYKIDLDQVRKEPGYNSQRENSIIEGLKSIIDKRIEALNINDSVITTASYGQEKHIIVQIPLKGSNKQENDLNIKRAKEAIGKVMKIEFKELRENITQDDIKERQNLANNFLKDAINSKYSFLVNSTIYKDNYENIKIGTLSGSIEEISKKYFPIEKQNLNTGIYKEVIAGTGILNEGINQISEKGFWVINIKSILNDIIDFDYIFISERPSKWKRAQDSKGRILNDKYFLNSSVQYNQAFQPMVELTFNSEGAEIFGELTTRLKGKQIAIFVGGEMLTAPIVNESILNGKAIITGNYTPAQAQKLSNDINTGVVPAPIYLTSERAIDSKLGTNSLEKLINAGIYGFLLIFIFLIIVYKLSGLMAFIALSIYLLIVLSLVKAFGIVLTLASIAGLILSIGIAIDANILIFERIKDELKIGHNLEKSIKNGFNKSWSAIWDSNLTGLIISIILYVFGINMIKGFGLMLGIGIIVSLFTVMFISRFFIILITKNKNSINKWLI